MNPLDAAEWCGAVLSILGAYLTARREGWSKFAGFWVYGLANLILVAWAFYSGKNGILVMQACFIYATYTGLRSHWGGRV